MSRIGKRIQEERMKKGMSPKQLGKKCGVSESFIFDIETGSKIINEKLLAQISKVLKVDLDTHISLEEPKEEATNQASSQEKKHSPFRKPTNKKPEVEPLAQWEEALSNIIKKVPIYDIDMKTVKSYRRFPIIDKKVEGYHPDKLIYIQIPDDRLSQYRIKKGDLCLIYLNRELINNAFQLVAFDGRHHIRKAKRVAGNRVQLIEGIRDDRMVVKDMKDLKILGQVIRVEIDFKN